MHGQPDLLVIAGEHSVELRMDGYGSERRTVEVPGADTVKLRVVLEREDSPAPEAEPEETSLFHLGLSLSEGFVAYDGTIHRSNVGLELLPTVRPLPWFGVDLGIAVTVEAPVAAFLRPGVRFHFEPMYARAAIATMLTPVVTAGFFAGLGAEVRLTGTWRLFFELDVQVWFETINIIPVDGRIGVVYGF